MFVLHAAAVIGEGKLTLAWGRKRMLPERGKKVEKLSRRFLVANIARHARGPEEPLYCTTSVFGSKPYRISPQL